MATKGCAECGAVLREGARSCPLCGARAPRSWRPIVSVAVLAVGAVVLFRCAVDFFIGPTPPMSLVPELPPDVEIVTNATEYSDGAGGIGDRVLVLSSASRSPVEVAADLHARFDAEPEWSRSDESTYKSTWSLAGHGRQPPSCTEERTSASIWVAKSGEEVEVGRSDTVTVSDPAVVLHISTGYHVFTQVGRSIFDEGTDTTEAGPC